MKLPQLVIEYSFTGRYNFYMSIQVHPGEDMMKEQFSEHGRQDESYVVVPASLGEYRIRNLGNHPICIHKTRLKDDYRSSI